MSNNKLTKVQIEILMLLFNGWQIGRNEGFNPRHWMQSNGIGKGGEMRNVNVKTFNALLLDGYIQKSKQGYPTSKYDITEKGKKIVKNAS